ncbi:PaaI family thioesterase [candidate division WOR-3 bacterium]|nr:PaaI family thioesterase [candidate division WOR-3 bacterium]
MSDACFACGTGNKNGLHLDIVEHDSGVQATIDPPPWSAGYRDVVHGGIVATILDELAVWAAFKAGHRSVTAELAMRMKDPMKIGQTYTADARVVNIKHRLIAAESRILDRHRALIASATVKLLKIG